VGLAAALGLVAALAAGCGDERSRAPVIGAGGQRDASEIRTSESPETARDGGVAPQDYVAVVITRGSVSVAPRVAGTLTEVRVEIGQRVEAGDVIAVLDKQSLRESLAAANATASRRQAEHEAAKVTVAQTKRERDRAGQLQDAGVGSQSALEEAEFAKERAKAALAQAKAALDEAQVQVTTANRALRDATVKAPMAGTVAARYVDPGAQIGAETPIVRIITNAEPWVRFAVPASDGKRLREGDLVAFRVTLAGSDIDGLSLLATVQQVAPQIDPLSGMILAQAKLVNETSEATDASGALEALDARPELEGLEALQTLDQAERKQIQPGLPGRVKTLSSASTNDW
jgi:RND family efflux transporter MFP subunit